MVHRCVWCVCHTSGECTLLARVHPCGSLTHVLAVVVNVLHITYPTFTNTYMVQQIVTTDAGTKSTSAKREWVIQSAAGTAVKVMRDSRSVVLNAPQASQCHPYILRTTQYYSVVRNHN